MHPSAPTHSCSRRLLALAAALVGLFVLAGSASAAPGELKHADRTFLEKAAKAGQKELQISQLAMERADNPQIRNFATAVAQDQLQLNTELTALAVNKGIAVPVVEVKLDKWSAKKATDFDKDYVNEMIDEHDEAISLFEKAAKSGDADIAAFAQKYLPKLQAHHTEAKAFKKMY